MEEKKYLVAYEHGGVPLQVKDVEAWNEIAYLKSEVYRLQEQNNYLQESLRASNAILVEVSNNFEKAITWLEAVRALPTHETTNGEVDWRENNPGDSIPIIDDGHAQLAP